MLFLWRSLTNNLYVFIQENVENYLSSALKPNLASVGQTLRELGAKWETESSQLPAVLTQSQHSEKSAPPAGAIWNQYAAVIFLKGIFYFSQVKIVNLNYFLSTDNKIQFLV